MNILVIDPGFGNTKVCFNGATTTIQSAVVKPVHVGEAIDGMRISQAARRVVFDGLEFAVGEGAWNWGRSLGSMDYAGIVGPERLALIYGALSQVAQPGDLGECQMVIGLPVPLLMDEGQMKSIKEALKRLKREHSFVTEGSEYRCVITGISYRAQPMGAFYDWQLNADLSVRDGSAAMTVAVLDVGMNTLDLFVVDNNALRPGLLGGDKVGVRRLLELANLNGYDVIERDGLLRAGRLKLREAELDIWLSNILDVVERTWPTLRRFHAVIPTGGGAMVLGSKLQGALAAKGAALYWPEDPITANVRGLYKYAARKALQRADATA
jgi:hypothetical protein